jgi:uncharacterized protein (DUF58 family)
VLFSHVAAAATGHATYRGRLMERGRYRFGPLRLSTRFPLGLVRRIITCDQRATLLVCPRLGRLSPAFHRSRHQIVGATHRSHRRGLAEGEFHSLRDWRAGDSRRWIHWRTSARRGGLVVRQFEQQQHADLTILIDLWQPQVRQAATDDAAQRHAVELAVSFAATVAAEACRRGGGRLTVGTTGQDPLWVRGAVSAALLQEVMEGLALVRAGADDDLPPLVHRAVAEARPGSRIILVGTRPMDVGEMHRQLQTAARRPIEPLECYDASDPRFGDYFDLDPRPDDQAIVVV